MKILSYSMLLILVAFDFMACGQVRHRSAPVSVADIEKVRLYERKSAYFQHLAPDSSIYFAKQGLKLAQHLGYRHGEAIMMNRFARVNEQYDDNLKLALKYQQEALVLFSGLGDSAATADATARAGLLEAKLGNRKKGLNLMQDALKRYTQMKDIDGIIQVNMMMAKFYELTGDKDKALLYYAKAEALYKGRPETELYFNLLSDIGRVYTKQNDHQRALAYYEKGIAKSEEPKYGALHVNFLRNAGDSWEKLGDKQKALKYHQRGLAKAEAYGIPEEQARSMMSIAMVSRDKDVNQSIMHLNNALRIANAIGNNQLSAEIYHSLTDLYKQQQRYEDALQALENHHRLLDSLRNVEKGHKIAVLQSSYEIAESKAYIESLEVSNQKKTFERNAWIVATAGVLVFLLILWFHVSQTNRLNKRLQESNSIKDRLFSIIGHDLRNPVGGVTQLLALMDEGALEPEQQQQMIAVMHRQSEGVFNTLNSLLRWGEAQLKGIHVKLVVFTPIDLLKKNIEVLGNQAGDKSITIRNHVPAGLQVYGDPDHFDFIIRNLLSNAIKFSHPSGIIEVAAQDDTDPHYVVFSVKDEGTGISKKQQELFLDSNIDIAYGTKGEKGTGIGLMLSKEFIKANSGKIWIASEENKGTTVYFTYKKHTAA